MIRNSAKRFHWLRFLFPVMIVSLLCLWLTGSSTIGRADGANAVQNEILIGLQPGASLLNAHGRALGPGTVTQSLDAIHVREIKLPAGMTLAQGLTIYRSLPGVAYAEANHIRRVVSTPNDTGYANQYGPWRIQADKAWDLWQPNGQTIIAIVDTGVDNAHPDLTNKILRDSAGIVGWNASAIDPNTGLPKDRDDALDDYGHGTHCAGIAAAQTNNGQGIAGIAGWDGNAAHTDSSVKIMPVKVLVNGSGSDSDVASGIMWAADHGAQVISMSLGGSDYSDTLNSACQYAWQKGCVIVAAAGNDGSSSFFYPAANANVISVAATDSNDTLAGFSNWGSWVQVAAPGVSVYSTLPTYPTGFGSVYGTLSGTSMACPHVAGEAALLRSFRPQLTNVQTVSLIKSNVDPYNPSGTNTISSTGGRINALRAIQAAANLAAPNAPTGVTATAGNTQVTVGWNPVGNITSYNLYRATSAGGEGTTPYKTGITSTSYIDTGLTNGTTYYYKVSAVNAVGESALSAEVSAAPTAGGGTAIYRINCGGGAIGSFAADNYFSGGVAWSTGQVMDTSGATNPAPEPAYQTVRYDPSQFTYSFPGLTVGSTYRVRLHMIEPFNYYSGTRPMNVSINGSMVLTNYDPANAAGASFKAVIPEFSVPADSNGKISITFMRLNGDVPCVAAIEILSDTPQPPSTPTGVTATAGNAQATVSWNAVSGATSYNLYRATSAGGEGSTPVKTGIATASYTDTGLTNGTTYYYKVSAVNAVGESGLSAEVNAKPTAGNPPPAPTGVTATAGNTQVTIAWSASSGAASYNLYRATSAGGEGTTPYKTGITSTSYIDTGLTNGTTYYYKVSAVNAVGESGLSAEVSAAPTAGGGTAIYRINCGGGAIGSFAADNYFSGGVAWSTNQVMDTSGAVNPAPAAAYQTVRYDPSQFTYSFPGLAAGTTYTVRLHMIEPFNYYSGTRPMNVSINGSMVLTNYDPANAGGGSFKAVIPEFSIPADSNGKISITFMRLNGDVPCVAAIEILSSGTPQPPSTPTGVTATAGNAQVALSWNAVSGATSYNLYRATSAGGEGTTPYKTGIATASYTDTGLTNGTTYYYKVSAVNAVGESGLSAEVNAKPTAGNPPPAPTGVTATAGNTQVTVAWTASSGATSYNLYRASSAGGEGITPYKTGITSTSYVDTGLTNGTTYFYKVSAVNAVGESGLSTEVSATPTAGVGTAIYRINCGGGAIGNFAADNYFSGGVAWSTGQVMDTSGATNPAPEPAYQTARYDPSQFSYTFPSLAAGATYKVRLHMIEPYSWFTGTRPMNVDINGSLVLTNYDPATAAGGSFKAVIPEFSVAADSNGKIKITFIRLNGDVPCVAAIEILN